MVKPNSDSAAIQTLFQLIVKQQQVSEQTNRLVQDMLTDVRGAQNLGEKLAILSNRVENLERGRTECMGSVMAQLRDLDSKRELNKDRIAQVEQSCLQKLSSLKADLQRELQQSDEELRERVDQTVDPVEKLIGEMREKIAFNAGKYGGIVALVISLVTLLLQYILNHPIPKQP